MMAVAIANDLSVYVGVDQSLTNTGVSIWCPSTKKICIYKVSTKPDTNIFHRLLDIEEAVSEVWADSTQVSGFFLEVPYQNSRKGKITNPNSYTMLVRLETALVLNAITRGTPSYQMRVGTSKESWNRQLGCASAKQDWREALGDWLPPECTMDESDSLGVLWGGLTLQGIVTKEDIFKNEPIRIKYGSKRPENFQNKLLSALGIL